MSTVQQCLKRLDDVIAAIKEGREAYREGCKPCDNPYLNRQSALAKHWASGYSAEKRSSTGRR
ncbi:hypothetical protein EV699_110135 [Plasticicumulans lactativorans]|uniref:Uncharacterized protein n=1 Tax=Plasticicumulans lactativorans TaxID=1133106 RepID=A0A4R2L9Z8_9GAMM|nr:hypothetical protein [Plasticicumulans lactativorans]TCO81109.1 hypothetical protein EV699_110135 [Plasticicumulans lactativorans]